MFNYKIKFEYENLNECINDMEENFFKPAFVFIIYVSKKIYNFCKYCKK